MAFPNPRNASPDPKFKNLPDPAPISFFHPMTLADFTSLDLILPDLRGHDAASAIQELSQALQHGKKIADLLPFYHAALNHEFLVGSDSESGLAFPHARVPDLKEPSFAMGRSQKPLDWGSKTFRPVRLVFLIAVPATDSSRYLLLNSALGRLASDGRLVEKMHSAREGFQMLAVLREIKFREVKKWPLGKTPSQDNG